MNPLTAQAISTRRLDLLPLHVEHAEEMAAVLSDPALHAFLGGTPDTPQALRSRYQRLTAGSLDPAVSWLNVSRTPVRCASWWTGNSGSPLFTCCSFTWTRRRSAGNNGR